MDIGQKVRVRRLRDRTSQEVINRLGQVGIIRDYKMVDGSGVGVIVQFDDKFLTWFFEDELEPTQ
jgi:chromosome segregation and condensation protein ScpB